MNMSFGKFKDKPVAWVMIEKPQYFAWMKKNRMDNNREYLFMKDLLTKLNAMPFINKCWGNCPNPVTRLSLYDGTYSGEYWFCATCRPTKAGAMDDKLTSISILSESILTHKDAGDIIKAFAKAKGIPSRKTETALKQFFGY